MADITKCTNLDCPFREHCRRATADPSYYQAYAYFEVVDGDCEFYIEDKRE